MPKPSLVRLALSTPIKPSCSLASSTSNAARVGDDDESRVLLPVSARGGAFSDFAGAHIPQAYRIVRAAGRDLVKRLGAWECGWGPRNSRVAVQTYGPRLVLPASALDFDPAMTAHVRARVQ